MFRNFKSSLIPALFSVTLLAGCSASLSTGKPSVSGAEGRSGLEVTSTVEEQALGEVANTPTDFRITIDEDRHAWERARLFFEKYLNRGDELSSVVTKVVGSRWALSNVPGSNPFVYEVWRDEIRDGYRYRITCKPSAGNSQQQAQLNAKNLARFIRDGKLEVSLISG